MAQDLTDCLNLVYRHYMKLNGEGAIRRIPNTAIAKDKNSTERIVNKVRRSNFR